MYTFRTVAQKEREGPLSQNDFLSEMKQLQSEAAASPDISDKTAGFWKMESLGFTLVRHGEPGATLNDPQFPTEARPIAHVGMGAGSVEGGQFVAEKIREIIESLSHPDFNWFAYESLGAMLALYEPRLIPFERMMMGLTKLERPEPREFLSSFSEEIQRLISHGFGRLLYFRGMGIKAAVQKARGIDFLKIDGATQGVAFAYLMVNHAELDRALEAGQGLPTPELVTAFRNGLTYALEFFEWMSPGFLDSLQPATALQEDMIAQARQQIETARSRGWLAAFKVEVGE